MSDFDGYNVDDWVEYIQTLHAREIELSLDRVRVVYQRLFPDGCPFLVISVSGTNGKGSTTEMLASMFRQAGHKAGKFTSPHLIRFNERFSVCGMDVDDVSLVAAFNEIESVRGLTPITYFEYGLLLALVVFAKAQVDIAILEVGLGGRLDAVNILDADVAIITSIAMDHSDWLGDSLEKIAFEKAGIARADRPCVVGVRSPQQSMLEHFTQIHAQPYVLGQDFDLRQGSTNTWQYQEGEYLIEELPLPFGQDGAQLENASLALTAVRCLKDRILVPEESIREGLLQAEIAGRCQLVNSSPKVVIDVAHNEASVQRLSQFIDDLGCRGRLIAICGMLKDKEIAPSLSHLLPFVHEWHFASIDSPRGSKAFELAAIHSALLSASSSGADELLGTLPAVRVYQHDTAVQAYESVHETLTADDCLLVFGSFFIAGDILSLLEKAQ